MAIINPGDWPIDAAATTGNELADLLNRLTAAIMSGNSSTTRPPDITAGMVWTRANVNGSFDLLMFRGTADVVLMSVASGGAITVANTYTRTEVDNRLADLQASIAASTVSAVNAGAGITITGPANGTRVVAHSDTSAQGSVSLGAAQAIASITLDTYGHITGITTKALTDTFYNQAQSDARFVNVGGDTMSGSLTLQNRLIFTGSGGGAASPILALGDHGFFFADGFVVLSMNGVNRYTFELGGGLVRDQSVLTMGTADNRYQTRLPNQGTVGSYAMLRVVPGGQATFGQNIAAANLTVSNASGDGNGGGVAGTWKCMGYAGGNSAADRTTLFQRIA